jgi:hypothetical protein
MKKTFAARGRKPRPAKSWNNDFSPAAQNILPCPDKFLNPNPAAAASHLHNDMKAAKKISTTGIPSMALAVGTPSPSGWRADLMNITGIYCNDLAVLLLTGVYE